MENTTKKAFLSYGKLQKYLGEELYCREERQFAVFLYNIFLEAKGKGEETDNSVIRECLGLKKDEKCKIKEVFFEATLMRDYFHFAVGESDEETDDEETGNENEGTEETSNKDKKGYSKEAFNTELLDFCLGWLLKKPEMEKLSNNLSVNKLVEKLRIKGEKGSNRHLGQKEAKGKIKEEYPKEIATSDNFANLIKGNDEEDKKNIETKHIQWARVKACLDIASMMMNATPDILVVYEKGGKNYAKAIECKYLSDEGTYKDVAGSEYRMQLFIQECIMNFCFGKRKEGKEHIPQFPDNSKIWKDAKKKDGGLLWNDICKPVYEGILKQERESDVINAGVEMIKFEKTDGIEDGKGEKPIIKINDKVSMLVVRETSKNDSGEHSPKSPTPERMCTK